MEILPRILILALFHDLNKGLHNHDHTCKKQENKLVKHKNTKLSELVSDAK